MGDHLDLATGRKVGTAAVLFAWGRPRPTSVPSGILIHPTVWPQYPTLHRDRQYNGPVAQGETKPNTTKANGTKKDDKNAQNNLDQFNESLNVINSQL